MLYTFDNHRSIFTPYGVTCELWAKSNMLKPDRHNEIEINYLPSGSITYLFYDRLIEVPEKKFTIFWALAPHQIIRTQKTEPYYVCTIPFNTFLQWDFPKNFVENLLKGYVFIDDKVDNNDLDLIKNWEADINSGSDKLKDIALLEINARLQRLAYRKNNMQHDVAFKLDQVSIESVEKMAAFIAVNYHQNISTKDVANTVALYSDYANRLFKTAFGITIKNYILEQRVAHAKRLLSTSKEKIATIAFEAGFNSISRFNATFKSKCGYTPKAYRKLFYVAVQ